MPSNGPARHFPFEPCRDSSKRDITRNSNGPLLCIPYGEVFGLPDWQALDQQLQQLDHSSATIHRPWG